MCCALQCAAELSTQHLQALDVEQLQFAESCTAVAPDRGWVRDVHCRLAGGLAGGHAASVLPDGLQNLVFHVLVSTRQ